MALQIRTLRPETVLLIGGGLALAIAGAIALRAWLRARTSPEERERQRRAALAAKGKIIDAILTEIREDALFYSYRVRGLEYAASQDISAIRSLVPADVVLGLGPVFVKYLPTNPANSIVLAEQWCGLHSGGAKPGNGRAQ
jgi:hypothetical protein